MAPDSEPPASRDDIDIAIICALPGVFDAAMSILDQVWDDDHDRALRKARGDLNASYVNGRIWQHNVVLVLLPERKSNVNAAIVSSDLRHSYCNLRLALLVGVCGAVPKAGNKEILLGDVIISSSLVQYDFGRMYPDGFHRKKGVQDDLAPLKTEIAGVMNMLATNYMKRALRKDTVAVLQDLQRQTPEYTYPGAAYDKLFQPDYHHKHQIFRACVCQHHAKALDPICATAKRSSCDDTGCDDSFLVKRSRLEKRLAASAGPGGGDEVFDPEILVGAVASGDTVMKSALTRDRIAKEEGIIAFETGAAGIWEHVPCLVVKGVCNYADSHKNKKWQHYATGTAASVAKALLGLITPTDQRTPASSVRTRKWFVPFPPNPDFVDQPEISAWLREKSQLQGGRVALVGLAGTGKSELAMQFAYGVRDESHVFWVNAATRATLEQSCRAIADKVGPGGTENSLDDRICRIGDWLGDEQNGRWTVVLDNLDDASVLGDECSRLLKFLPQTGNGFTLITSRTLHGAGLLAGSAKNMYSVGPMREEVALKLFQASLKNGSEREEREEVVRLLGHMPLAISHAAAYINRRAPWVSPREYARMFRESDDRRKTLLGWKYPDLRRGRNSFDSVLSAWAAIFDQIQQESPSAIFLLSLLSFFSPHAIPEWALKPWYNSDPAQLPELIVEKTISPSISTLLSSIDAGRRYLSRPLSEGRRSSVWDCWMRPGSEKSGEHGAKERPAEPKSSRVSFTRWSSKSASRSGRTGGSETDSNKDSAGPDGELEHDLDTLVGYSLVTLTTQEGVLAMHPLVRYCIQEWLSQVQSFDLWKRRFMLLMSQNIDAALSRDRSSRGLITHLSPIVDQEPVDLPTARLWIPLSLFVYSLWQEDESTGASTWLIERIVDVADRVTGKESQNTLICMSLLARALCVKGEYEKAAAVCEDVLERAERANEGDSHAAQESRLEYSRILLRRGRLESARRVARDIVERRARVLGPRADDTLWVRANLADVLAAMGRLEEAGKMAIALLREDWTGRDSFSHERTMNSCAEVALKLSGHQPGGEVEVLLREMVAVAEANPGCCRWFPHMAFGPFHCSLAQCLEKQGKLADRASTLDRGLEHMTKLIPMPVLQSPKLVGSLLEDGQKDTKKARRQLLGEVIENLRSEGGESDAFYWGMANIGRCLYMQGRATEAFMLVDALYSHLKGHTAYGEAHTLTKQTWSFRGDLLWRHSKRQRTSEEPGTLPDKEEGGHKEEGGRR